MMAPGEDSLIGTALGGRYRIARLLGAGAMGAVYEAVDASGSAVAVKVMHAELARRSQSALMRFVNETRATAQLRHPNIAIVLDGGIDEVLQVPYLVMELLRGMDVEALLARLGPLEPTLAVRIVIQAAQGLAAAHATGLVHRDVKPSNLFLELRQDGSYLVKVCDFGTAKLTAADASSITRTGAVIGSPLYMSPEQARSSKHVDARADVWSLGVVLYRLLCGRTPHEDIPTFAELLTAISVHDTPHLQDYAPWVDPALTAIVHAALLRDPGSRWPSMTKFARGLFGFAGGDTRIPPDLVLGVSPALRSRRAPRASLPGSAPHTVTPPASSQEGLLGGMLAGRYRLVKELGRGGMGAVYQAEGLDGRQYAIKVVLAEASQSPDALRRFVREARASTDIVSPNVVRVVEADTDLVTHTPFIAMELLNGVDLDYLIESTGPLDPVATARVFRQACRGLAAAHARSIVHRDIKPANIFLDTDPSGVVTPKICDFGIAKQTATDAINQSTAALTATGGLLGSPIYMSPEQAKNAKNVDFRTDIWSLCVSMYQALSGSPPWSQCTTVGELILAICTESLPPLARIAPWVDPGLAAVVERGLVRDPAARWRSIEELYAGLAPFTGGSDELGRSMLIGVPQDARWASVQRAVDQGVRSLPSDRTATGSGNVVVAKSADAEARPARTPRTVQYVALGVVGLAIATAGALTFLRRSATASVASAPSATLALTPDVPRPSALPSAPPVKSVTVVIEPPNAQTTVNGVAQPLHDGVLSLEGEPGQAFAVVAMLDGAKAEQSVLIRLDGTAEPDHIRVPVTAAAPRGGKPHGKGLAGSASSAVSATVSPKPEAAKPAASAPSGPKFQKEWQ